MSTYKKLNKQDAYITTYTAQKTWAVQVSEFPAYGITTQIATGSYLNSLQQLYYPAYVSGAIPSHSFNYSYQTSIPSSNRNLTTGSLIFSIPREVYGTHIQPGLVIDFSLGGTLDINYVLPNYWSEDYIEGVQNTRLRDDGEGSIYVEGTDPRQYVGDIIYNQGMVILTDSTYIEEAKFNSGMQLVWKSNQPIYTHNYHCKLRDVEYSHTYNPTAMSSSIVTVYDNEGNTYSTMFRERNGQLTDKVMVSEFQPYITTVGLYNDTNELIAVGKLSQPVPKSRNTEMTIIVKIDI